MKPGDIVRVKDPSSFISAFSKKIADRDAVINWVGPNAYGHLKGYASVTFQKRNGRGKEFRLVMYIEDFVVIKAEDKTDQAATARSTPTITRTEP